MPTNAGKNSFKVFMLVNLNKNEFIANGIQINDQIFFLGLNMPLAYA